MAGLRSLALAGLLTSGGCHDRQTLTRRIPQCAELRARVEQDLRSWPAGPPALDLRFSAHELLHHKTHPHGGRSVCFLAGAAPDRWSYEESQDSWDTRLTWSSPTVDGARAVLSYQLTAADAFHGMNSFMEVEHLAPARGRGEVLRETSSPPGRERRRLLVTREAGALHLLVLRWPTAPRDGSTSYFRCEAVLAGAYEAALPLFEAACDGVRVRMWEFGW